MFFNTFAIMACGLAAGASAHITMAAPLPFTQPAVTQAPLSYNQFPCQTGSAAFAGPTNTMALGDDLALGFNGEAVHGGGSCQISITYDTNPNKDSVWKVIKSFEGGCPARNTVGNLGDDTSATAPVPFDYNVTIPTDIPSGAGTLAWTWLNKVGNREFYMNCAAIELTGTGGSQSDYDSLPDMFVGNLPGGSDTCTVGTGDFVYPNPGAVVEYGNGGKPSGADVAQTTGACTIGVGGGSGSGATATATASATPYPTAGAGGVFATVKPVASSTTQQQTSTEAATTAAPVATGSADTGSTSGADTGSADSGAAASTGTLQTGACTTDGDYTCLGSTYQVCASGVWSVAMTLAGGTECTGQGASFAIAASSGSKKSKFRRSREARRADAAALKQKRGMPLILS